MHSSCRHFQSSHIHQHTVPSSSASCRNWLLFSCCSELNSLNLWTDIDSKQTNTEKKSNNKQTIKMPQNNNFFKIDSMMMACWKIHTQNTSREEKKLWQQRWWRRREQVDSAERMRRFTRVKNNGIELGNAAAAVHIHRQFAYLPASISQSLTIAQTGN